ncbi:MAG: exodeoxyribonuclease I [Candidatus Saccharimonadales bacterium]
MAFYFYDLETSGINARAQRIMQFAGQRTDENFQSLGEPQNWLVKLSDEILPDPDAVLITGITPQKTLEEGYSEAEFLKLFYKEVLQPDTIICGFNTIRFDDEFMRNTLWRNFYDPYEWQWQDGRSRWDLLDVVRMVRALRPDGITWPVDEKGQPTNRLELLTKANGLDHENAHDALSDVRATIAVAQLLKQKQPKMFEYLLSVRIKKTVQMLLNLDDPQPFVYTSGRFANAWQKTTVVVPFAEGEHGAVLVYDLRQDPDQLAKLDDTELSQKAFQRDSETELLPVKALKDNKCPAVAPLGVFDTACQKRLHLSMQTVEDNLKKLRRNQDLVDRLGQLFTKRTEEMKAKFPAHADPDFQLYDGFLNDADKGRMSAVRAADMDSLVDLTLDFTDERLSQLLPRYKARNFPRSLTASERSAWEEYRRKRLARGVEGQLSFEKFAQRLAELVQIKVSDEHAQFLLQELQLYAESIAPDES